MTAPQHGIEPRFEEHELHDLSNDELIDLKRQIAYDPPYGQWTEADYEFVLEEIALRFAIDNDQAVYIDR